VTVNLAKEYSFTHAADFINLFEFLIVYNVMIVFISPEMVALKKV